MTRSAYIDSGGQNLISRGTVSELGCYESEIIHFGAEKIDTCVHTEKR
jgi:hypothetical protein